LIALFVCLCGLLVVFAWVLLDIVGLIACLIAFLIACLIA
jgi:hypothetical protein